MPYKTIYSPPGANANFSLGMKGGGFSLQKSRVAEQDVYIGYRQGNEILAFPYYAESGRGIESFDFGRSGKSSEMSFRSIEHEQIQRTFGPGSERFESGSLSFDVFTPGSGIPDPESADEEKVRTAVRPGLLASLDFDNRNGTMDVTAFFAVGPIEGRETLFSGQTGEFCAITSLEGYGFSVIQTGGVEVFGDFDIVDMFSRETPLPYPLGPIAGFLFPVAVGERRRINISLAWYLPGVVTGGTRKLRYWYTRYFQNIYEVLEDTLKSAETIRSESAGNNNRFSLFPLNPDRKFLICQSVKSYYASTMLFDDGGRPRWVVNEGSFMMLNTFDLTVDHLFYEIDHHPWAVRNQLDSYADEYSYHDTVHSPDNPEKSYPGGVSFSHDQGVFNVFSPFGESCYEIPDQSGCFSFMTQEQLCNFILCSAVYVHRSSDSGWARHRSELWFECLESMVNRDASADEDRDGIMDLDSDRCGSEGEITTYDSIDPSLGQARRNLYLGMKCFSSYLALEYLFDILENPESDEAASTASAAAVLCEGTILRYFDNELGYIPSLLDGVDKTAIISAIEPLVYPVWFGFDEKLSISGRHSHLVSILKTHFIQVFESGLCRFDDGGWKLSSSSRNSWMSKIFLSQYVAERILGIDFKGEDVRSDKAHADWWRIGCPTNPGIDQIFSGTQEERNFHYPRAVTSYLFHHQYSG